MAKRSNKPVAAKSKAAAPRQVDVAAPPMAAHAHPPAVPLSAILGQDRALATLQAAMRSGRIHHAWIFHGPAGVGKFTAALAFAALLLDPTTAANFSGEFQADPESTVQRLIRGGTHPDLHVITKELAKFSEESKVRDAKQITIAKDVVETHLLGPAALAPTLRNGGMVGKVFIVDEAELLDRSPTNAPTQNALLKTMEEPAERTVIILVTSSEERLLATIRSRCQRVSFGPLAPEAMAAWLKREKIELEASRREWLLAFADGSPGVFTLAHEGGLHEWHVKVSPMLARVKKGEFVAELGATFAELIDGWAKSWVETRPNASKDAANKAGADWLLRLVGDAMRGELRMTAGRDAGRAAAAENAIQRIRTAERHLDSNVSIALAMESLSADLSAIFAGEVVAV